MGECDIVTEILQHNISYQHLRNPHLTLYHHIHNHLHFVQNMRYNSFQQKTSTGWYSSQDQDRVPEPFLNINPNFQIYDEM